MLSLLAGGSTADAIETLEARELPVIKNKMFEDRDEDEVEEQVVEAYVVASMLRPIVGDPLLKIGADERWGDEPFAFPQGLWG